MAEVAKSTSGAGKLSIVWSTMPDVSVTMRCVALPLECEFDRLARGEYLITIMSDLV